MIKSFQEIGKLQLEGLSDSEKRKKFLETQTILPNEQNSDNDDADKYREIIINLDLNNDEIEIKSGDELYEENREQFFGFDLLGRRSKKIYFTCNNLYYHLLTVPQMLDYIDDKFQESQFKEFKFFLENLKDNFYNTSGKKSFFKLEKFKDSTADKLTEYLNDKEINHKNMQNVLEEYVSKDILGSTRKNFVNNLDIFSLKINGKYITESEYNDDYIDIVYFERQGRFFDQSENMVKEYALCGTCNEKKLVTGKIDIPTKFYVTSSPYFFENLNDNSAYKSFGICQECYQEVMVGISKVEQNYYGRLFNRLRYYVIPKNINKDENYDRSLEIIKDIFADQPEGDKDHFEKFKNLKKKRNFKMDFLFWRPDQASFIVLDSIDDVSYDDIKAIFRSLRKVNQDTYGHESDARNYKLYFNDLYWLLFPNYRSHNSPDPKLYRKEMLNLFDSIMKDKDIDYNYLIRKFITILNKRYYFNKKNEKEVIAHPLKMNLMLSWLNQITNLKGGYKVREGSNFTEIEDADIRKFFEVHSETYEHNSYRQGLFLLGILMNQVLKEQQKENKSANILDKLSFDGMPVRRVKKFTKDITEILNIYDEYNVNQLLHAQMIDRVQGIENSSLNKDEVVFYILSGLSFGRYLGHKYYNNKKGDEK
ncbi:CRISPR-associated Csh1 family protein [Halanaerobium saccharolyticum]|uniref:CRISPR-associated Csh1 family protein n=1 Tax=Halanaerobium saccharolyticum TaxID=43595 RepID=A0A2T5RGE2_9FIRM|nr:type I-B CRISPR-associated protein Cas8b/Csh1 [Halanaerobium saccharolyticum]PTV93629.1 CRISPR-associated Csh1 family protein [Halanaerobium saccharolyticum]